MKNSAATAADRLAGWPAVGDLFKRLEGAAGLVLAVSGGPDSTALMVLMAAWAGRPPVLVVSVDHGLRPEAAQEAEQVARNAAALGLPWRNMRCAALDPGGNLQARAREARYRCLAEAARDARFDAIVTAHHQDDQAETFLLRLARGSGVYGLAAMAEEGTIHGLRLLRPLLTARRSDLARIAAESGLPIALDASNSDMRFDRVRMRAILPLLAEHGLGTERLARTAARLARAAEALDRLAGELVAEWFSVDFYAVVRGPLAALAEAHEEIGLRALSRILTAAGGAAYPPRLDRLESLYRSIVAAGPESGLQRTLHGAVVSLRAGQLTVRREWGRRGLETVDGIPGATVVWDRRFRVRLPLFGERLTIGPLGATDRRLRADDAGAAATRSLPGLFEGKQLVAAPAGVRVGDRGAALEELPAHCLLGDRLGSPALLAVGRQEGALTPPL